MGNFEDNWLISSVPNSGKNHKIGSNSQKVPDKQKQRSKVAIIPFAIFKCLYLTKELASLWLEMQREVTLLIFSQNYIFLALYRSRINISNTIPARARLSRNRIKTNVPCQPADKQTVHVALNWPKLRKKTPKFCQKYQKRTNPSREFNKEL